jgi:hypothetical protein
MLLLLRSPPSGAPAATIAATGSLTASGTTGATTLTAIGSLAVNAIELHVFGTFDGQGNLQGLSQNFVTATAAFIAHGDLAPIVGFGPSAALAAFGNLTATVGSIFQGIAALNASGGLTVAGKLISSARYIATGSLNAVGTVTGGIVTPAALLAATGSLTITGAVLATNANLDGSGDLQGQGFPQQVGFATQMRLSFSADEIRLFFRKG